MAVKNESARLAATNQAQGTKSVQDCNPADAKFSPSIDMGTNSNVSEYPSNSPERYGGTNYNGGNGHLVTEVAA